jgi:hypothetical protein
MARNLVCSECGSRMQGGFVPEEVGNAVVHIPVIASYWVKGKPVWGWNGLKVKDREKYFIFAYRCEQCGLLDLLHKCAIIGT